jgi:exosortase family protein XrtF
MDFKMAAQFVIVFLVVYVVLNFIYQFVLWLYLPSADGITVFTAYSLCKIFNQYNATNTNIDGGIIISYGIQKLINIKESCNGIAILNTLISFMIAFRGKLTQYLFFLPAAFFIVFVSNIFRLFILIEIKRNYPEHFHFFHVYVFPAILYSISFVIMILWVKKVSNKVDGK